MGMPERRFSAGHGYRYGFNGKENDTEIKGEANNIDFGSRIYDPRLGRWNSVDPVVKSWLSTYQNGSNNPINLVDPDGGDEIHFHYYTVAVKVPTKVMGDNGVPRIVNQTVLQTYRWVEIVKDNKKDRFFVHRNGLVPKAQTVEFYPSSADQTKSGATSTSYFFNSFSVKDDDYTSLQKLATEFPELQNQVLPDQIEQNGSRWSQQGENRAFWGNFYKNLTYKKQRDAEQAQVDQLMLGVISGVATELLVSKLIYAFRGGKVAEALNTSKNWLGKDFKHIRNKAGDDIFISKDGLRKIRFDIKNSQGDRPHVHLEELVNGKWKDATDAHRLYPKPNK